MADAACEDRPLAFEDLVRWFEAGCKPASEHLVGAEHEKFVFRRDDHGPVPYDGPAGIRALLDGLMRFGWKGVYDILTGRGYNVSVVQNPLTTFADAVAATDRVLARQDGPVVSKPRPGNARRSRPPTPNRRPASASALAAAPGGRHGECP